MDLASSDAGKNRSRLSILRDLVVHLRLHYQLLLAPIFLWGYFLAGSEPDRDFWVAFLAYHVFLYGGATAFNSYYDRDEGPVGGLTQPPPVTRALLPFSLVMQSMGALLAALVDAGFLLIYLTMFVMGVAYSHPAVRLKKRPVVGLTTVGLGQGVLASLGGWVTATPTLDSLRAVDLTGIVAVTLVTVGFYPITQIYQIDEDRGRGDLTFAAWAGPRGAFAFAIVVQGLGAVLLTAVVGQLLGLVQALVVGFFYTLLLIATVHWARTFDGSRVLDNYRRVMRINVLTSFGFLGFIGLHLFGIL